MKKPGKNRALKIVKNIHDLIEKEDYQNALFWIMELGKFIFINYLKKN